MLKWIVPAMVATGGIILVIFGGFNHHMNLVVTPSIIQAFAIELEDYTTGNGTTQLDYDQPLPVELIKANGQIQF